VIRAALAICLAVGAAVACGGSPPRRSTLPVYLEVAAIDGGVVRLRELRGKPVVIHLFTVGSMAAQMDVAQLNAVHDAGTATVIGIALDPPDAEMLVRAWPEAAGAHYRVAIGHEDLITGKTDLGPIPTAPATIVLDRGGAVVYRVDRQLQAGELARAVAAAE